MSKVYLEMVTNHLHRATKKNKNEKFSQKTAGYILF